MRIKLVILVVLGGLVSQAAPAGNLVPGGRLQPTEATPEQQPQPPAAAPTAPQEQSKVGARHAAKPRVQRQPAPQEAIKDGNVRF